MAIAQRDAKRMLAHSSIAQVGYIGVGLGTGHPLALAGAILHIMNHAAMKSCLFLVTGSVELQTGIRSIRGWNGLGRRMPWTFLAFTLAAAAMVGIPPTSGFFSKWYLALGLAAAQQWVLLGLLIFSSLLTAGYFARVIERVFARRPGVEDVMRDGVDLDPREAAEVQAAERAKEAPTAMVWPLLFLGLSTLVLGLLNSWFVATVIARALPASMPWPGLGG
jgi:multicomponent Na+:H+ antiporter subunit D